MKTYDRCPQEVADRALALIEKFHRDLASAEVTIDYIFVSTDGEGPALSHHGYPALAIARIVGLKDRAAGRADAEIVIARDAYIDMPPEQQDALLDHELNHFQPIRDEDGHWKTDDHFRPRLKIRKHDHDFGWFDCIAARHGSASIEVQQARQIFDRSGQILFPFLSAESSAAADAPDAIRKVGAKYGASVSLEVSSGQRYEIFPHPSERGSVEEGR